MATVYSPIAKDESFNTTESPSRNIADVLAQELTGIANAITGGNDKAPKTDIATVEPANTASRAYSVGELVYVNGNLYKVITAIASGATFTVGTNIQSTNVSDTQITSIGNMYNVASSHAAIRYQEYVNNHVVFLYVDFTATSDAGTANIDSVTLSELKNPPITEVVACTNHSASASDLTPITLAKIDSNKSLQLRGRLYSGRSGLVTFTYLIR